MLDRGFCSESITMLAHIAVDVLKLLAVNYNIGSYHSIKSFSVVKYQQSFFIVLPGSKYKLKANSLYPMKVTPNFPEF